MSAITIGVVFLAVNVVERHLRALAFPSAPPKDNDKVSRTRRLLRAVFFAAY